MKSTYHFQTVKPQKIESEDFVKGDETLKHIQEIIALYTLDKSGAEITFA